MGAREPGSEGAREETEVEEQRGRGNLWRTETGGRRPGVGGIETCFSVAGISLVEILIFSGSQ